MDEHEHRVLHRMERLILGLYNRLDRQDQRIRTMSADTKALLAEVAALTSVVPAITAAMHGLLDQVAAIEPDNAEIRAATETVRASVAELVAASVANTPAAPPPV